MRDGVLAKFNETMGRAMFVSHQWASNTHPDPAGKQLKVFQETMANLLQGTTKASPDFATEAANGRAAAGFSTASLRASPIFVPEPDQSILDGYHCITISTHYRV